jgi:hypothetical protein
MRNLRALSALLGLAMQAAAAFPAGAQADDGDDLAGYCTTLTSFYDRFGASRSQNSDGARNMTRIGAGIDCKRGDYEAGISTMHTLLLQKRFTPPSEPAGLAQASPAAPARLPGSATP